QVEATLLAGPVVKFPISAVANVLNNAQIEKNRSHWALQVRSRRGKEFVFLVDKDGTVSPVPCTLGDGDEKGETIEYAVNVGEEAVTKKSALTQVYGLIFKNAPDAKAPRIACKLQDAQHDLVVVSTITLKSGTANITTPAGAKLELKQESLTYLDYTKGKM